jgi:hypothetical protein
MTYGTRSASTVMMNSHSNGVRGKTPIKHSSGYGKKKEKNDPLGQCDGRRRMKPVRSAVPDPLYSLDPSEHVSGADELDGFAQKVATPMIRGSHGGTDKEGKGRPTER